MCTGGGASSTPPPIPPPPPPEPLKPPNQQFVRNRKKQYMAAGLPGTNPTGGLGVMTPAATTNKAILGV